jgi:hypothetical protein
MKKFTLIFAFILVSLSQVYSQATMVVTTPPNMTTTQVRAPNGLSTHAFLRASSLVLPSELSAIPMSSTLTSFGFTTTAGANTSVAGTITVYLQNSGDMNFNKGTSWSTIITGMTQVYSGPITLPTGATTIDLTLSTPFTYLGNSVYVAYDFTSGGPYATTPVTYGANSTLINGCVSASSSSLAPTTLASTNFRPTFRFGFPNPLTNDISVETIESLGSLPAVFSAPHAVTAVVKNNAGTAASNVNVNLNISGANTFTDMKTIPSLAGGAVTTVTFSNWTPLSLGFNTLAVTVASDQNNANNNVNFKQEVTCTRYGNGETPMTYTGSVGYNTGGGIIAASFMAPATATVLYGRTGISTNAATVGNPLYMTLQDNSGNILATSNTITVASGNLGTMETFTFTPVTITASTPYHIGLAQTANATGYFPLATYPYPIIPLIYSTSALTGGTLSPLTSNLGMMALEVEFAGSCAPLGVKNLAASNSKLMVYPNPASDRITVKLNSVSGKAFVEVYNSLGQLAIPAQDINGTETQLNVSTLAKGIYIVKVTNGKEVTNTRIAVEK